MKKVLLTGFEPFLHYTINPTAQIAEHLHGQTIGHYEICGKVLPVQFSKTWKQCLLHIEEEKPDAVLMLGLAAGRYKITPERVAINCADGEKDNEGLVKQDERIQSEGPAAYFSTLPFRTFVNVLQERGLPAELSNTAGTYLCNYLMYQAIHYFKQSNQNIPAGFIHVPASHKLALEIGNVPSFSQQDLTEAVSVMIQHLSEM
ncbi:pyroglutamyl-peptidase I [Metabacillus idriensis]|uniref:pyroglutamyl-peptidase I n=1 Tax=Metabacillus idriensis TaxID=324768 RepID=UPI0017494234|nr:pyroglutamyl-peptidase I [Metabacillus idriensis]